jgi:molybdopterin/thiamine biosynthesis adenylyltransferase
MDFLTRSEKQRDSRQILYPAWGGRAQHALKKASVFIAGAGGLGCPVISCLAAAGVGCLRVYDQGEVEHSNLNRQILYSESHLEKSKVEVAKKTVKQINPSVHFEAHKKRIGDSNIDSLIADSDLIIDCLDNFETRFLLNAYAVKNAVPLIHGGVRGLVGQLTFIHSPFTPCLRCMIGEEVGQSTVFPILGATAGIIGSLQALEALKYITKTGELLAGRILFWDGEKNMFHLSREQKRLECPVCGPSQTEKVSRAHKKLDNS